MAEAAAHPYILEQGCRLSQSRLWRLQRNYYAQHADAWASGMVPHYITCNAYIAHAYARVVRGWLDDCAAAGVDETEPLYIVELGAGSGRFAYLFLKELEKLGPAPRFTYVLTDFTDEKVAALAAHPQYAQFGERIAFARFDVERDRTLTLSSGQRLERTRNPLAVVANYYFDTIPQDVFFVADGELYECLSMLTMPAAPYDAEDPSILRRLTLSYEDRPAAPDYYGDPELDPILARYCQRLSRSAVKFPVAGFACCRALRELSGGRMLLLSGDKGHVHDDAIEGHERPGIAVHGSFSMNVNYHALGEWFKDAGGRVLAMDHRASSLNTVAFLLGVDGARTGAAFADFIASFGPDDFFNVRKALEAKPDELSLEQALAALRLGRSDPRMVLRLQPRLRKLAADLGPPQRRALVQLLDRACALHFHIGEEHDFSFDVGVLLVELGEPERALEQFRLSLALYGPDAGTLYNLALSCYRLGRTEEARGWIDEALVKNPEHAAALRLSKDIRMALDRPNPG